MSNEVLIAKDTPPIKVLCDTTLGQMLEASFGSSHFMGVLKGVGLLIMTWQNARRKRRPFPGVKPQMKLLSPELTITTGDPPPSRVFCFI